MFVGMLQYLYKTGYRMIKNVFSTNDLFEWMGKQSHGIRKKLTHDS